VCLDCAVTPVILVRQKQQSETWSWASFQIIGMAKGIEREYFTHAARRLEMSHDKNGEPPDHPLYSRDNTHNIS